MPILPENFLLPYDDGLAMRRSNNYARYKLKALEIYIEITNTAMKDKPWRDRYYIDLQAGPGKNIIGGSIVLGSPLVALTTKYPFTQYCLNEYAADLRGHLESQAISC